MISFRVKGVAVSRSVQFFAFICLKSMDSRERVMREKEGGGRGKEGRRVVGVRYVQFFDGFHTVHLSRCLDSNNVGEIVEYLYFMSHVIEEEREK